MTSQKPNKVYSRVVFMNRVIWLEVTLLAIWIFIDFVFPGFVEPAQIFNKITVIFVLLIIQVIISIFLAMIIAKNMDAGPTEAEAELIVRQTKFQAKTKQKNKPQ